VHPIEMHLSSVFHPPEYLYLQETAFKQIAGYKRLVLNKMEDTALVDCLRSDDTAAFDALYWRYHQAVYANVLKLTKEADAAKDIVQEVFITLWEKRSSLDKNQSVSGWLFVVSYNKSVSYLKKRLKLAIINDGFSEGLYMSEEPSFHLREDQFQLLEEAVEQLSPQKKKVFELCKLQGKTYEMVASELHISKHTVKEYLSAAMVNVKDYIQNHPRYLTTFAGPLFLSHLLS
jgi:RNA polymerase sigma factor (sigma-70 family)